MKNIINHKEIENVLSSFKSNERMSLSLSEKENILKSVFDRAEVRVTHKAIKSPFSDYKNYFVQYLRYSIPVLLIAVLGTQLAGVFTDKSKLAISDMTEVKTTLKDIERDNSIKSNLYKTKQDIHEIKSLALSDSPLKTQVLANQVSDRSKEIRNQVAALMDENKITEAKKIALDLETALKADELYKVSTSVEQEVFASIDLRVDIEKKESSSISSSTESDISKRIETAKKELSSIEDNSSTTDMIAEANKAITVSEGYLKEKDFSNAIISLQLYDRILAEVKAILIP